MPAGSEDESKEASKEAGEGNPYMKRGPDGKLRWDPPRGPDGKVILPPELGDTADSGDTEPLSGPPPLPTEEEMAALAAQVRLEMHPEDLLTPEDHERIENLIRMTARAERHKVAEAVRMASMRPVVVKEDDILEGLFQLELKEAVALAKANRDLDLDAPLVSLGLQDFGTYDWDAQPADWVIPHLLVKGECGALVSAGGVGKTLLARDIAYGLASPTRPTVFGIPVAHKRVLYLDFENSRDQLRLSLKSFGAEDIHPRPLLQEFNDYLGYVICDNWGPLTEGIGVERTLDLVMGCIDDAFPIDLIVVDTMSKVVGDYTETQSEGWTKLYKNFVTPLKKLGVSILFLDHMKKDGEGPRGSSAKHDNLDVQWLVSVDQEQRISGEGSKEDGPLVILTNSKNRSGRVREKLFLRRKGQWTRNSLTGELELDRDETTGRVVRHLEHVLLTDEQAALLVRDEEAVAAAVGSGWARARGAGGSGGGESVRRPTKIETLLEMLTSHVRYSGETGPWTWADMHDIVGIKKGGASSKVREMVAEAIAAGSLKEETDGRTRTYSWVGPDPVAVGPDPVAVEQESEASTGE